MYNDYWVVMIMVAAGAMGGLASTFRKKWEFPAEPNVGKIPEFFNRRQGLALILLGALAGTLVPMMLAFVSSGLGLTNVAERIFVSGLCGDKAKLIELYLAELGDGSFDKKKFAESVLKTSFDEKLEANCVQDRRFFDLMILWGISFAAGFVAWNLIPNLANRVDNRLSALKRWEQQQGLDQQGAGGQAGGGKGGGGGQGGGDGGQGDGGGQGGGGPTDPAEARVDEQGRRPAPRGPSPFASIDE